MELYDVYMKTSPILNALLATLYIGVVANVMYWAGHYTQDSVSGPIAPMAALSLFVLSAAIMGWLFLGRPAMLYLDGHKREAIVFFGRIVGAFAVITAVVLAVMIFVMPALV